MSTIVLTIIGAILSAVALSIAPVPTLVILFLGGVAFRFGLIYWMIEKCTPGTKTKVQGDRQDQFQLLLAEYRLPKGFLRTSEQPDSGFGLYNSEWKGNDLVVTPGVLGFSQEQFRALVINEIVHRQQRLWVRACGAWLIVPVGLLILRIGAVAVLGTDLSFAQAVIVTVITVSYALVAQRYVTKYAQRIQDAADELIVVEAGKSFLQVLQRRQSTNNGFLKSVVGENLTRRIEKIEDLVKLDTSDSDTPTS